MHVFVDVVDDVNVVSVDGLFDDEVVEVEVVGVLDDVVVVTNLINVAVDVVKYDGDADDGGLTVEVMDALLIGNDDNDDNEDDVNGIDDVVCEAIPVDVVVDDVRVVDLQVAYDTDGNDDDDDDDDARSALMNAKEKTS